MSIRTNIASPKNKLEVISIRVAAFSFSLYSASSLVVYDNRTHFSIVTKVITANINDIPDKNHI